MVLHGWGTADGAVVLISEVQRDYARQISRKAVMVGLDSRESPGSTQLIDLISIVFRLIYFSLQSLFITVCALV